MVERLKAAIEKAREQRGLQTQSAAPVAAIAPNAAWAGLAPRALSPKTLRANRIVGHDRSDRANAAIDILRTRIKKASAEHGWRVIGVTSPTKGCGKSVLSANVALSFARQPGARPLLLDFDLRFPALRRYLGLRDAPAFVDLLRAGAPLTEALVVADGLAIGVADGPETDASEVMQSAATASALQKTLDALDPTIVIMDLPPILAGDDTIGFMDKLDAILLVAAAGQTRSDHIRESEALIGGATPLIGVVLNKCGEEENYVYDYTA